MSYDKKVNLTPQLAVSWKNTSPTTWSLNLRRGVKFSDGTPFTADDVVFSYNCARESGSTFKLYSNQVGKPRKIDDCSSTRRTPPIPSCPPWRPTSSS